MPQEIYQTKCDFDHSIRNKFSNSLGFKNKNTIIIIIGILIYFYCINKIFIMRSCPSKSLATHKNPTNKNIQQSNTNISTLIKKRKNIHVCSLITSQTNPIQNKLQKCLQNENTKVKFIKIQSPLHCTPFNQQQQPIKLQHQNNIALKMKLCSQNLCQIQFDNPCRFDDYNKNIQDKYNINERVVYSTKKRNRKDDQFIKVSNLEETNNDGRYNPVTNSPSNSNRKRLNVQTPKIRIALKRQIQNQKNQMSKLSDATKNKPQSVNYKPQSVTSTNFTYNKQKNCNLYLQTHHSKGLRLQNPNHYSFQSFMKLQLSTVIQQSKNPTKTTDNSFSIINNSLIESNQGRQIYNQNINRNNNSKNSMNKIHKLKQIYWNTHQSSDSVLDEDYLKLQFYIDEKERENSSFNSNFNNSNHDINHSINQTADFNIDKSRQKITIRDSNIFQSSINRLNSSSNSARTIIDLLDNLDEDQNNVKSQIIQQYCQKKPRITFNNQIQINPQNEYCQNHNFKIEKKQIFHIQK